MKYPLITLYVPGNKAELIAKAPKYKPDAVILDLEDAVPESLKVSVRTQLAHIIPDYPLPTLVRVNNDEAYLEQDVKAVAVKGLYGIVLPMVETADQVRLVDQVLTWREAKLGLPSGTFKILIMIETPLGVIRCYENCKASPRVESVIFASAEDGDMQAELKCAFSSDGYEMMYPRAKCLHDARAAKLPYVLDGAYSGVKDMAGLELDCVVSRRLGYDGRTLIYPGHLELARKTYAPSAESIRHYTELVRIFDANLHSGSAAIVYEGKMIDYAMYKKAKIFLKNAEMYFD